MRTIDGKALMPVWKYTSRLRRTIIVCAWDRDSAYKLLKREELTAHAVMFTRAIENQDKRMFLTRIKGCGINRKHPAIIAR